MSAMQRCQLKKLAVNKFLLAKQDIEVNTLAAATSWQVMLKWLIARLWRSRLEQREHQPRPWWQNGVGAVTVLVQACPTSRAFRLLE